MLGALQVSVIGPSTFVISCSSHSIAPFIIIKQSVCPWQCPLRKPTVFDIKVASVASFSLQSTCYLFTTLSSLNFMGYHLKCVFNYNPLVWSYFFYLIWKLLLSSFLLISHIFSLVLDILMFKCFWKVWLTSFSGAGGNFFPLVPLLPMVNFRSFRNWCSTCSLW